MSKFRKKPVESAELPEMAFPDLGLAVAKAGGYDITSSDGSELEYPDLAFAVAKASGYDV